MASNIPPPTAAFDADKAPLAYEVMRAGAGNAWEDRGSRNILIAFFVTCLATLFRPGLVCDQIRRPETTGDATTFGIGCGILWGLGWVGNSILYYYRQSQLPYADPQLELYTVGTVLQFALAPVLAYFFMRLGSGLFYKLIAGEMEHKFTPTLAYNVLGYGLGPSILAVIPVAGAPLALLWCLTSTMVAAKTRLYLRAKTAVICTIITYFAAVVLLIIGYFVVQFIWNQITGGTIPINTPPPRKVGV